MIISIPYHTGTVSCEIDDSSVVAVLEPKKAGRPSSSPEQIVMNVLRNPIGSPTLRELARGKRRITVITSDHTRAMPSSITLPLLLAEIRQGNPDADITILIATGLHRATTVEEQCTMFGQALVSKERIVVSDAMDAGAFIDQGPLPSGAPFEVHASAADCDLLVSEGFIEPHFFAGYSGGRKSVLPGVCSQKTINYNHAYKNISHKNAVSGVLRGNPVHEDMIAAARRAKLAFILNVTLDSNKNINAAFAGDPEEAHLSGVRFSEDLAHCPLVTGDIVITGNGGYPLDQNLYQTSKAASTAALCAGDNGVIILCSACVDGVGGARFEQLMTSGTPEQLLLKLRSLAPEETISEQWNAQVYAHVLKAHPFILVTSAVDHDLVKKMNMLPAGSLEEALAMARGIKGESASVVVLPDGVATLPGKST